MIQTGGPRSESEGRPPLRPGTLLLGLLLGSAITVAARAPTWGGPFSRDESSYMTVGREIIRGHLPLVTAWEQRPPMAYLPYALAGLLPGSPDHQLDALSAVGAVAVGLGIFGFLRQAAGDRAALAGLWIHAIANSDISMQGQTANMEIFVNLFILASFVALLRFQSGRRPRDLVLAGLLLGASGTFKELSIAVAASQAAALLFFDHEVGIRKRVGNVLLLGGAAVLPWAAIVMAYSATGQLGLIVDTFRFNTVYAKQDPKSVIFIPILPMKEWTAFRGSWPLWALSVMYLGKLPWVGFARIVARLYLPASIVMIVMPGHYYPHYYQLGLPPIIIGSVLFLDEVPRSSRRAAILAVAASLALACYLVAFQSVYWSNIVPVKFLPPSNYSLRELSRMIGAEAGGRDASLLNYGYDPQVYLYSGLRPAQPVLLLSGIDRDLFPMLPDDLRRRFESRIAAALAASPPAFIVLQKDWPSDPGGGREPSATRALIAEMIARDYEPWSPPEAQDPSGRLLDDADVRAIYRRRGLAAPASR